MDIYKCTLVELRQFAKEKGIKNYSKLKKEELIEELKNLDNSFKYDENKNMSDNIDVSEGYKLTNRDDEIVEGVLEVLPDGYGFLRGENYLSTSKDVYISPIQIRRFRLDKGDKIKGIARQPREGEKFPALIYVGEVNSEAPD